MSSRPGVLGRTSGRSPAGDALTALVLKIHRLNGRLLDAADGIASDGGLTAARWQVLGAVLEEPLTVAAVARRMGLTRQSVQRQADALAGGGLCQYLENPAHRRARLLSPTRRGRAAIAAIGPVQARWANRVAASVGEQALRAALATADALLASLAGPALSAARSTGSRRRMR